MSDQTNTDESRRAPELPAQLSPYLILLGSQISCLPVCRNCQTALLPKSLLDHLRKHHNLPTSLNSAVKTLVASYPPLDYRDIPNLPDDSVPVTALRIVPAFQCKHCHFIRRDLTDVRKHVNKEHGISAAGAYEQVKAQSWFGGHRAVYWRVKTGTERELERLNCFGFLNYRGFGDKTPKYWDQKDLQRSQV